MPVKCRLLTKAFIRLGADDMQGLIRDPVCLTHRSFINKIFGENNDFYNRKMYFIIMFNQEHYKQSYLFPKKRGSSSEIQIVLHTDYLSTKCLLKTVIFYNRKQYLATKSGNT